MADTRTFEVEGKKFEIKLIFARIDMYEQSHRPIMASFAQNGGSFSLGELRDLVAYGIKHEGGNYVSPQQGREMGQKLIEENGYLDVFTAVTEALTRDCGFFFKTQSA